MQVTSSGQTNKWNKNNSCLSRTEEFIWEIFNYIKIIICLKMSISGWFCFTHDFIGWCVWKWLWKLFMFAVSDDEPSSIHKPDIPLWAIMSFTNAPTCAFSECLSSILKRCVVQLIIKNISTQRWKLLETSTLYSSGISKMLMMAHEEITRSTCIHCGISRGRWMRGEEKERTRSRLENDHSYWSWVICGGTVRV